MNHATWGQWYWPLFLIAVAVAFLPPETYAIITNSANSLSDYAWHGLGLQVGAPKQVHSAAWILTQGAYITVAVWLLYHIWYMRFR